MTTGTVTFTDGATTLAANVAVNGSGVATFTTSSLAEGNHLVKATYNGNATFATSNATVNQRVDNNTTQTGTTYCNTGAVTISDNGPSTPYPSNIFISGAPTCVVDVTATLKNVTHAFDGDIEAMLVGPAGQNLVVVSDAGTAAVTNVTVNLDDAAAGLLPAAGSWAAPNSTITVKPTNYSELTPDSFPAPAPAPTAATTLATFNATNPNGTWSLYVKDDGAPDSGSIAGGWCLNFTFDTTPPSVIDRPGRGPGRPHAALADQLHRHVQRGGHRVHRHRRVVHRQHGRRHQGGDGHRRSDHLQRGRHGHDDIGIRHRDHPRRGGDRCVGQRQHRVGRRRQHGRLGPRHDQGHLLVHDRGRAAQATSTSPCRTSAAAWPRSRSRRPTTS